LVREQSKSPAEELEAIAAGYDWAFDEPESLRLVAKLREAGVLSDPDWTKVLESLRYSMENNKAHSWDAAWRDLHAARSAGAR
jgi:hypothetical protein